MSAEGHPYEEGSFTVIGPECFAAEDGSVLNWRGRNYVPQEESKALREALEGLAQAARWFSSEADYTVPEVIESEFIEALETAEDLLRERS